MIANVCNRKRTVIRDILGSCEKWKVEVKKENQEKEKEKEKEKDGRTLPGFSFFFALFYALLSHPST